MKAASRPRLARIGALAVLAIALGSLLPATGAESASAATDGKMVVPASGNIQSKVGDGCRDNYRKHDGIDISNQGGTPILAAYDGVIKTRTTNSGYGNYVDIQHPGGYVTRYGHMESPGMQGVGTTVTRGQQIGVVGKTGATTAYHLHFEVWRNGSVYTAINNGFTCLSNVTRGATLPMEFPGLGTVVTPRILSGDFDRDGRADLLGVAADGDLHFLGGTGRVSGRPPRSPRPGVCAPISPIPTSTTTAIPICSSCAATGRSNSTREARRSGVVSPPSPSSARGGTASRTWCRAPTTRATAGTMSWQ